MLISESLLLSSLPQIIVDEFRTSSVCPKCSERLYSVRKKSCDGKTYFVRGLKWCPTCGLWDRDYVGAYNIFVKGRDKYPTIYDRPSQGGPTWESGSEQVHVISPPARCHVCPEEVFPGEDGGGGS